MNERQKIVIVCGPTGSGKTALGVRLARLLDGEVVEADSRHVYIGMDIGTWKPTQEERNGVPHHLIDVVPPDGEFNAFIFKNMAAQHIRHILLRRRKAIIVGGTGLYMRALTRGLACGIGPFEKIRKKLRAELASLDPVSLHERLGRVDPVSAERIHSRDAFRIVRALEVYLGTGTPLSSFHQTHAFAESYYDALWVGISPPRSLLYEHINWRVEEMFRRGLLEEVVHLKNMGYGSELPSMKGLGYAESGEYLAGRLSLEHAKEAVKRNTRRYAKRQMTWFRAEKGVRWYESHEDRMIDTDVVRFFEA